MGNSQRCTRCNFSFHFADRDIRVFVVGYLKGVSVLRFHSIECSLFLFEIHHVQCPSGTGTFEMAYVRVRKPDGSVVETPPENVQEMAAQVTHQAPFYSDLHEKHVAVKGLSVGDVLEFRTEEHTTKPLAPVLLTNLAPRSSNTETKDGCGPPSL